MSHSYATRCALIALLLLSSTTFVQTTTIDIPANDVRIVLTPSRDNWPGWNHAGKCPGIWSLYPNEKHTISLNFTGVGITVYGYAEATPGSWRFQIDDEAPQELLLPSDARLCRAIKDRQDLNVGNHRVTLTPFTTSFVLTKFSVTTDKAPEKPQKLATGKIVGIAIGAAFALLLLAVLYFVYKRCSR